MYPRFLDPAQLSPRADARIPEKCCVRFLPQPPPLPRRGLGVLSGSAKPEGAGSILIWTLSAGRLRC